MVESVPSTHRRAPERFHISAEVAEIYEKRFVPALFADWAGPVVEAAGVEAGDRVLDVACGTGIAARVAADRVGPTGEVTGVDLNPAMLDVARRIAPGVDWSQGDVGALPFPEASFDRVLCQMALMFFVDRPLAVREITRVVRPGGTVAVMTPASLDAQPAWGLFVAAVAASAGPDAVELLSSYWSAGNRDELTQLMTRAGLTVTHPITRTGTAVFDSLDSMITTEVESTPLAARLTPATYARIRVDAKAALAPFEAADGTARLPLVGHIVAARRQAVS